VATSADQHQLPLSHEHPKLIGKTCPATNGIRTSTKYQAKLKEQTRKVNPWKYSKKALRASIF
jgi:hypothetical protein